MALNAAQAAYFELDTQYQDFQRKSLTARVAQLIEGKGDYGIREIFEALAERFGLVNEDIDGTRALIIECPGIDGQALTYDPRFNAWSAFVLDALQGLNEQDFIKPGLTEIGAWKVSNDG